MMCYSLYEVKEERRKLCGGSEMGMWGGGLPLRAGPAGELSGAIREGHDFSR